MITTLKITTLFAALLCVCMVGFVGAFGLKGDPQAEKLLSEPSFVDGLKKNPDKPSDDSNKISPLVKQAQAFAKRINPPPPPKPPTPLKQPRVTPRAEVTKRPEPPKPPTPPSAKFEVIATCRYEDNPDESMVLLNLPAKGLKWVRVGENVEHLMVAEITDGGVIMSDNGRAQNPIAMKQTPSILRSLLAEDGHMPAPSPTGNVYSPLPTTSPKPVVPTGSARSVPSSTRTGRIPVSRFPATRKPPVTPVSRQPRTYTPASGAGSRTPQRAPVPTAEERKAMLDGNIADIKRIMAKPTPGAPKANNAEEASALSKLLDLLEKERQQVDQPPKKNASSTTKAPQAE